MTYYVTKYDDGGADDDGDEKMVGHLTAADERRSVFKVERSVQRRERVLPIKQIRAVRTGGSTVTALQPAPRVFLSCCSFCEVEEVRQPVVLHNGQRVLRAKRLEA